MAAAATGVEVTLIPVVMPLRPGGYVASGETWERGWVLAKNSAGVIVEATATTGLVPQGFAWQRIETAPSDSTSVKTNVELGQNELGVWSVPMASGNTFSESDPPAPIYMVNNQEFGKSGAAGLSIGGLFLCLDQMRSGRAIAIIGPIGYAIAKGLEGQTTAASRNARGVVYNNQADLTAFTVASDDGITYVAGDRVLLVGQTTAAQNGLYVVGTVASGTAPLTRAPDMPSGVKLANGVVVEISEGTVFQGSTWKAMTTQTGGWTVGTHDPLFYPRVYKQKVTLAAGTYTIGVGSTATPDEPLFLFSVEKSTVTPTRRTANTSTATTGGYAAPESARVAGKAGTAVVVIRAEVAAGTINNADVSTLDVLITNW